MRQHTRALARHAGLWAALAAGLLLKIVLLGTQSVSFHSDEAIVGLMARHILQGSLPAFFYGQAYMGALDAYLVALSFLIFGQTVLAIRVVQVLLYLATLATTYLLALRLSSSRAAATGAALLVAVPPVMVSLYTTATLGDYGEILLLNNLLLLVGWGILSGRRDGPGWWLLAGLLAGLGWWSMALIVASAAPLALLGLWRFRQALPLGRIAMLLLAFAVGALPWVAAIAADPGAVFADFSGARYQQALEPSGLGGVGEHVLTLVAFGLPALFGLRFPWLPEWIALLVGLPVAALYLFALWQAARRTAWGEARYEHASLLGAWLVLIAAFVLTPFGSDVTGRYLLPLYPPLAALTGEWLGNIWRGGTRWPRLAVPALLGLLLAYNLWGNVRAMLNNPPGLTTQFNLNEHIPNEYDDDLIAFLDSIGADRGYATYWVSYRTAFLTQERIILTASLPYKPDLRYTPLDQRYPPYGEAVEAADEVVYVTANTPALDALLRDGFAVLGVSFHEQQVGPYTVFYNLSRRVRPAEILPRDGAAQ